MHVYSVAVAAVAGFYTIRMTVTLVSLVVQLGAYIHRVLTFYRCLFYSMKLTKI